jgi:hypothetical protein
MAQRPEQRQRGRLHGSTGKGRSVKACALAIQRVALSARIRHGYPGLSPGSARRPAGRWSAGPSRRPAPA